MKVKFKLFRPLFHTQAQIKKSRDDAAEFATGLGFKRLINISERGEGTVVWYWSDEPIDFDART